MVINAIFDDVKVYDVQNRLDVVIGQEFLIEISGEVPEGLEVFTNHDPVLAIGTDDRTVSASELGESKIKFMTGDSVVKTLLIFVVSATHPNATTLNATLGQPVSK